MSAYKPPKGELQRLPIPNITSPKNKQKKTSYIDDVTKYHKKFPGPAEKYAAKIEWCDPK